MMAVTVGAAVASVISVDRLKKPLRFNLYLATGLQKQHSRRIHDLQCQQEHQRFELVRPRPIAEVVTVEYVRAQLDISPITVRRKARTGKSKSEK
jgi:hypothetical protein